MSDTWCAAHRRDEPDLPGDYRACGECGHVFRTETELVQAHNAVLSDLAVNYPGEPWRPRATGGDDVHCCPLCTHDW